jgi:predicted O-methyltransferase YrrM
VGPQAYGAGYLPEDEPLLTARASAADLGGTEPVRPEVGAALRFLACAAGARTAVEIGTGCGTSGIWLLRGMRPGSTLTSVDIEPEYQRMARKAFTQAGFAQNQARLILGRALEVLPRLSDGAYDLVFCDADPREAADYLTGALRLLRAGGIVVFNNALLAGIPDDEAEDGLGRVTPFGLARAGGTAGDEEFGDEGFGDEEFADEGFAEDSFDDETFGGGVNGAGEPGGDGPEGGLDLAGQVRADSRLVPVLLPLGDGLLAAVKRSD